MKTPAQTPTQVGPSVHPGSGSTTRSVQLLHHGHGERRDPAFRAASTHAMSIAWCSPVPGQSLCTGGNTKESPSTTPATRRNTSVIRLFTTWYRRFSPRQTVICRVNGMRIGAARNRHGLRLTIAQDWRACQPTQARLGPDRGPPTFSNHDRTERAMAACVLCEPFSAHKAITWA